MENYFKKYWIKYFQTISEDFILRKNVKKKEYKNVDLDFSKRLTTREDETNSKKVDTGLTTHLLPGS